jgi:hypothetical protein
MTNRSFKPKADVPTLICLKYRIGKPFTYKQYSGISYTMGNGLIFRVPNEVDKEIQALHLDAGQPFCITKRTVPGSDFAWDVERVPSGPPTEEKDDRPDASAPTNNHYDDITTLPPAILHTEHGRDVLLHLIGAIEIAHAAEAYSRKQLGKIIRFSPNDIRAIAISCFIQQSHENIEFTRIEERKEPMVSRVGFDSGLRAVSVGERGNR